MTETVTTPTLNEILSECYGYPLSSKEGMVLMDEIERLKKRIAELDAFNAIGHRHGTGA